MKNNSRLTPQHAESPKPPVRTAFFEPPLIQGDVGPEVIQAIRRSLKVGLKQAVSRDRGFTWWPGDFAQHIDAGAVRRYGCVDVVSVRITTDWLCDVPDTPRTLEVLSELSRLATVSGFVWDRARRTVSLQASLYCHSQTVGPNAALAASCAVLQFFETRYLGQLAHQIGAKLDASRGPAARKFRASGSKQVEELIRLLLSEGVAPSRFTEEDFQDCKDMLGPGILANSSSSGLTAEFPFFGPSPVLLAPVTQTALLQAQGSVPHPVVGSGVLLLLRLPVDCERDLGLALAAHLNQMETWQWTRCHQLGSWCWDDTTGLVFASFIPSAFSSFVRLSNFVLNMGMRARWAFAELWNQGILTAEDVVARWGVAVEQTEAIH